MNNRTQTHPLQTRFGGSAFGGGNASSAGGAGRAGSASRAGRAGSASQRSKKGIRSNTGMTFIEIAATSFLAILFTLLGVDVCLLLFGAYVNDAACRDAARAAAQASDSAKGQAFAQAAVKARLTDGNYVGQPVLVPGGFVYQDFGGQPPINDTPYVTATTMTTVKLPAPITFFSATFINKMDFTQTYTFPIVKTKQLLP
jgi:hypothetical protein